MSNRNRQKHAGRAAEGRALTKIQTKPLFRAGFSELIMQTRELYEIGPEKDK